MKQIAVVPFPCGAESDGFIAALASAALPAMGIDAGTPYWCAPKGSYCVQCSGCDPLEKHQEMLYHALLTASGLAFTFDYPEDDSVGFHTLPGTPLGWRWEEPFVAELMDFAGLGYRRCFAQSARAMRATVRAALDAGYPALCASHGPWQYESEWARCWNVVCGYADDGLLVMRPGGETALEAERTYDDWIVITGRAERRQTCAHVLERIVGILTDPSHDALERELMDELSHVTPEGAAGLALKLTGINGVPIEARWHAAEAFVSRGSLLAALTADEAFKGRLSELFFGRYIADGDADSTHAVGWRIWGALGVGPDTGYRPTEESSALLLRPDVQAELRRLFGIVFGNDRAVARGIEQLLRH